MSDQPEYPSLVQQAKNLAKFTVDVVKDQVIGSETNSVLYASDTLYNQRLEICKTCNFYDEEQNRCKHCGCWLKYKARFKAGVCPVRKWGYNEEE
jgi:hypothetical protein